MAAAILLGPSLWPSQEQVATGPRQPVFYALEYRTMGTQGPPRLDPAEETGFGGGLSSLQPCICE